jgi:hypothetical protein
MCSVVTKIPIDYEYTLNVLPVTDVLYCVRPLGVGPEIFEPFDEK